MQQGINLSHTAGAGSALQVYVHRGSGLLLWTSAGKIQHLLVLTLSTKPSLSLNDMLDGLVLNLPVHLKSNSISCPCALATSGASEVTPCTALTGIGEGEGH